MSINKITLETDGLVVGDNQLLAQGGGIKIGKNLVVEGNTYVLGVIQFPDGTTQNTAGATGGAALGIDSTARATANSKSYAYYQGSVPPASQARDIWINSETGFVYENFGTIQTPIWAEFGPVTGSSVSYNTVSSVAFTSANIYGSIVLGGLTPMYTQSITLSGAMYDSNTAIESYIWNKSNGTFASGDLVAYTNNGSDSSGWINFGINSSNYNQTSYASTGQNEGYVLMSAPAGSGTSGNLVFATDSTGAYNSIEFYTGGFTKSKGSASVVINGNNLSVVDRFTSNTITANTITGKDVTLTGNLTASSLTISSGFNVTVPNLSIDGLNVNRVNVATDLTSTQINGSNITLIGNTRTNLLAVNTSITGTDITLIGKTITQSLDVNSAITGTDLLLQSSLVTNTLRSNVSINTTDVVSSNSVTTGTLTSNSNTYVGGTLFVNTINGQTLNVVSSNVQTLNVNNAIYVNGKKSVNGPAFGAYADNTLQTITSGSQQKVLFQVEEFDTDGCFANSRFTPTVEGYYQLNAEVRLDGSSGTGEIMLVLYKNTSEHKRGTNQSGTSIGTNFFAQQVSALVYANGTTDYFEIKVQQTSGSSLNVTAVNNPAITWFNGAMVRGA